ncbi:DNA cytosine methyltransferase, partial [Pseudomonas amygdali]|uniref:DNA cytosine methyltransferase n=1 Tax=Pseudomonas amygdali TaxID=47877 RepID=UPI001E5ADD95
RGEGQDVTGTAPFGPALQCGCGHVFSEELGHYGCPNCEGDEGPAVSMFGGIPAFGGHSLAGSVERSATLTAKDTRMDVESETFFVQPSNDQVAFVQNSRDEVRLMDGDGQIVGALAAETGAKQQCYVAGTLRSTTGGSDVDHGMANHLIAGTLQANGKAAGSATSQDAASGLLVVHGTQDPDVLLNLTHPLGRNSGQENVLAFSCKDHGADAGYIAPTLRAMGHGTSHANAGGQVAVCVTGDVTHTLKAEGFDGSEDGTGRGQPIVTHAIQAGALRTNPCSGPDGVGVQADHAYTLEARAEVQAIQSESSVRRLTPRECERLQGFPDDYTRIPWRGRILDLCPDGPRYKAIGNSKAVPVVRWIGMRIQQQL